MQFIFTGFTQIAGFRVFAFEGVGKDKTSTKLTVRADIGAGRKHGIHLQEFPLLCLEMLEQRIDDIKPGCELVFEESRMLERADALAGTRLAALLKRKASHKPVATAVPAFTGAA